MGCVPYPGCLCIESWYEVGFNLQHNVKRSILTLRNALHVVEGDSAPDSERVVKNKPRPVGLKNFVMTTSEGLMLDFAIYESAKTMFGESNLGLGPSVILSLAKRIPPGSCVYHDRYFTTVPLIEEMEKLNLHSTGTIMQNRIPDRATIKFKKDSAMRRGVSTVCL
ncbi:PiggyBac transposable element-derived protein 1 [Eumeta japonica]|uniref:PiggyBac transposable element-derived protein 1 n=1 Tax=Eumeta variegata TaxID=151549 RepID=A0A4C1VJN4_EUMVA|nr:PiggyBac transposable element-derived protein 1 [Eumeta japonica]